MARGIYSNEAEQAWDDADKCDCGAGDCHENNHKECGVCVDRMLYGSHESNEDQVNSDYRWNVDHIKPISKGGSNKRDNKQAVHVRCNQEKADN